MNKKTNIAAWPFSVLVTGATGGIGLATSLLLAGQGRHVIRTARSQEEADELVRTARSQGLAWDAAVMDLTDPVSCQEAVERAADLSDGGPRATSRHRGVRGSPTVVARCAAARPMRHRLALCPQPASTRKSPTGAM
ncbi:SDR family NAD(P)-dependent oxidoreductase [Streptomyces sp. MSC1_001]|uniref:SDR family NAD(P)-dependent oxidoreductase n=1 Tax=Streptomyces sp. MSC1_001 TaxID=2909263 RepID=UPI00202F6C80|nr:SDR family NAD(P)-dependent oxidoreductase [Streptomyces sp. MSC1_001]